MTVKQEKPYYCGPASLHIVQKELGLRPMTQRQWAYVAGTTQKHGTSAKALKRCLSYFASVVTFRGKFEGKIHELFPNGDEVTIVYDAQRDHWFVAVRYGDLVQVLDPEKGTDECWFWDVFRVQYLSSSKDSYVLVAGR